MKVSAPKLPPPPPPPPPPKVIPEATDPGVKTAQMDAEKKAAKRKGRAYTAFSGTLGDASGGSYGSGATTRKTALG